MTQPESRSSSVDRTMPFSEMARAIQHHPKHFPYLSRLEATRRCDKSLEAYRDALHYARTTFLPTSNQRIILHLPLYKEELCWLVWRTTLLEVSHTRAIIQIPKEFRVLFNASDASSLLPHPTRRYAYVIARKTFGGASATIRICYSNHSLDAVEFEWIGGTPNENGKLELAKTMLSFPFADHQTEIELVEQWPGAFSTWIEDMLREFVIESGKSCRRHECMMRVWKHAERAAKASLAMSITDEEVAAQLLRLPGNETVLLEEQLIDDHEEEYERKA